MLRHVISTNGGIQQVLGALDLSGKDLVRSGLWVSQLECTVPDVFQGKTYCCCIPIPDVTMYLTVVVVVMAMFV